MSDRERQPDAAPEPGETVAGIVARFDGPEALLGAARGVREAGFKRFDAHSPYPVHGMERAMGIRPTILPWVVLGAGATGLAVALFMQWWANATSFDTPLPGSLRGYQFLVSGKPYFSLPANIPIAFELIVLFSAAAAFGAALVLNHLPQFNHAVFLSREFRRATTDGFFISVEAGDPKFDETATADLLRSLGAASVEVCRIPAGGREWPKLLNWMGIVAVLLALLPPLWIAQARGSRSDTPRLNIVSDMDYQPKFKAQAAVPDTLFADGRAMRPPVPGTVAVGQLEREALDPVKRGDVWPAGFPVPITGPMMERGQERYNIYCATCHGLAGLGGTTGMTSKRAAARPDTRWTPPISLHDERILKMPEGEIYSVISHGVRTMPGHAAQVAPEDRWAIVLYVRALQRSQNAAAGDVPPDVLPKLK